MRFSFQIMFTELILFVPPIKESLYRLVYRTRELFCDIYSGNCPSNNLLICFFLQNESVLLIRVYDVLILLGVFCIICGFKISLFFFSFPFLILYVIEEKRVALLPWVCFISWWRREMENREGKNIQKETIWFILLFYTIGV